jgi:hypothetical protein
VSNRRKNGQNMSSRSTGYSTSVVRFFEIATNTHRLSTWVYTPLTSGGENMKELEPTEPLEVSEVRNW